MKSQLSNLAAAVAAVLLLSRPVAASPSRIAPANVSPLVARQAFAQCGKGSQGGAVKCGMNWCCSQGGFCGPTEAHCLPANGCQQGFGLCEMITPSASCGENSGVANKRTIGYYQANNVRNRLCNAVPVSAIKTTGFTHLYFSFASINPTSFKIEPAEAADEPLMRPFTALKKAGSLQTWIAVGGGDFSLQGKPTFSTWSDMAATQANRAAFIASAKTFMSTYGFQGMDIDWEFPGLAERGGKPADLANFVSLLREMRASFGTTYGISVAIPADYGSLFWFDAKAMEPFIDFFGFMSYDLHNWEDTPNVTGQADIREIYNKISPLAYDKLDMSKVNFGIALYGRGYTLANPSCNTIDKQCVGSGHSKPGPCTNAPGIMSLAEIRTLLTQGWTSRLLPDAMMKELVKGDQWIGYDDADTMALKKKWASKYCFGGTMEWAIDFDNGAGGAGTSPISTDGKCGSANGGAICQGWPDGECCSSVGWCGNSTAHCGEGCQSGPCT